MNKLKISIIVPVYGVEKHIERCLRSVMRQDYEGALECILVDDCTPDRSMEIAEGLLACYNGKIDFRIYHHDVNKGLSAARNTGIDAATGDYLFFLDSDDEIMPEAMSTLETLAEKYPGVDAVYGDWYVCKKYNLLQNAEGLPEYTNDEKKIQKIVLSSHVSMTAQNKLLRRSLFGADSALRFYVGIIHEDELFNYFLVERLRSMCVSYQPIYVYYFNNKGIASGKINDRKVFSYLTIAREIFVRGKLQARYRHVYSFLLSAKMVDWELSRTYASQIDDLFDKACKGAFREKAYKVAIKLLIYIKLPLNRIIYIKKCLGLYKDPLLD